MPKTSIDPKDAVEGQLKNRERIVEIEVDQEDYEPRRFAVYKHQTEEDLKYERQKYKHILDQQKLLQKKIETLNEAIRISDNRARSIEQEKKQLEQQCVSKDEAIEDLVDQLEQQKLAYRKLQENFDQVNTSRAGINDFSRVTSKGALHEQQSQMM